MPTRDASTDDAAWSVSPAARQRYAQLWAEAQQLQGVSLWQDAWRRLRRNRKAMLSLWFLVAMATLAVLTPVLPLQSPIDQHLGDLGAGLAPGEPDPANRKFAPPNLQAVRLGDRRELEFADRSLAAEVARYDAEFARLRAELQRELRVTPADKHASLAAGLASRAAVEHPFRKLWHNPGWLTRALIRLRLALFGDWCIPSICGSDALGRDVLARLFWGARVSLAVGVVATLVSLSIGVTYGAVAGYCGGLVDAAMMRLVDVLYAIPFIFVVIYLITFLSEDQIKRDLEAMGVDRIVIFYIVIGLIYWLTMARVVRGQVISLKHEQFIEAARTIGAGPVRMLFRHLVPNVMGVVIVYLTLTIPSVMLFEAFLSFLGLGVSPPDVSWGLLVNEGIQVITQIRTYWWLVLFPGLTLSLTLFALNFLGDGLRDALDPRMKHR